MNALLHRRNNPRTQGASGLCRATKKAIHVLHPLIERRDLLLQRMKFCTLGICIQRVPMALNECMGLTMLPSGDAALLAVARNAHEDPLYYTMSNLMAY